MRGVTFVTSKEDFIVYLCDKINLLDNETA